VLLYGADSDVSEWVSNQIFGTKDYFGNCRAIGVVLENRLIAGVVYNNQHSTPDGTPYMLDMSVASIDKRWLNRHNLRAFFDFPFTQLRLKRVQTHSQTGEAIMKFNERLGFKKEGLHREFWPLGGDSISWGMLKSECPWVKHG